jgi:hypothetical protein
MTFEGMKCKVYSIFGEEEFPNVLFGTLYPILLPAACRKNVTPASSRKETLHNVYCWHATKYRGNRNKAIKL